MLLRFFSPLFMLRVLKRYLVDGALYRPDIGDIIPAR